MAVFTAPEFRDHEEVIFVADATAGLHAIIAIHDTTMGPAGGGCRMWPYETEAAALHDALRLSRAMTYKLAFIDAPYGGGKAVIIGNPRTQKTEPLLRAMGRAVERLGGRFTISEDVGLTVEDLSVFARETEHVVGLAGESGDTSPPTARGIYRGILAVACHALGRGDLGGVRIAVQGLGNVGYRLCEHLAADGAHLVVTDVEPARVARAHTELGAEAVAPEAIYDQAADIFAPCALGAVINDDTIPRLAVRAVAGAANNQLAEDRHGVALAERGILYAPDYVINAGGAINASQEKHGYDAARARRRIDGLYDTLLALFERAQASREPTLTVADRMAEEKLAAAGRARRGC